MRKFEEIVLHYTPPELCPYPEYRGKPYYSIKYEENGEHFVGYGTYSIEVLSRYLREYFTDGTKLSCENCVNRNIKSKENCTSPFGEECQFFNATPDRSTEIAQKSIELGRSLGRTEERVESKRPRGKWILCDDTYFSKCSICGDIWLNEECKNYCPNCGAYMREEGSDAVDQ